MTKVVKNINLLHDVFTPTSIAKINYIERKQVNKKIVSSLMMPGKQIVIFGMSGAGKTTLIRNHLERLYEGEIITPCMNTMTFEELLLDAFDQLEKFYCSDSTSSSKKSIEASVQSDYLLIKSNIKANTEKEDVETLKRLIPPQLTPSRLANFLGEANYCWVLEDFHKMPENEKTKLSQIMKIFMDKADEYKKLKIIALGAVNTGREVVQYDVEMRNRVSEIEVKLMSEIELKEIITNGQNLLNIGFSPKVIEEIVHYSNGIASVCHSLCLYLCEEHGLYETVSGDKHKFIKKDLDLAITRYMEEISDTIKSRFDKALKQKETKYKNARLIFRALTKLSSEGGTFGTILQNIKDERTDYPQSNLTHYLNALQKDDKGMLISYDASSGYYSFKEPIFRSFALVLFAKTKANEDEHSLSTYIGKIAYHALKEIYERKYLNTDFEDEYSELLKEKLS